MAELFNNIMCIRAKELTQGDNPIMSKSACRKYYQRNDHVRVRKGGGSGNTVLLKWDSLRPDLREKYIEKYGNPRDNTVAKFFKQYLKKDDAALDFYSGYLTNDDKRLPDAKIEEYCRNAEVLNALHTIIQDRTIMAKALGGKITAPFAKFANIINNDIADYGHNLPKNPSRLKIKYNEYIKEGYISLVHKGFANKNPEKINDDAKLWLLAQWANQVQKVTSLKHLLTLYNKEAKIRNWKEVEEQTLRNFLFSEEIKPLWWGHRYGELKFKEKFIYQHSTKMPSMSNSLWYGDGTKLNYYYLEDGKMKTTNVYEVMDVYSEMLLGYCIADSEDYRSQFTAFRMAVQTSGQRPYQISFDNQGGHKKLVTGQFISKISDLAINTQPYNAKSKTIENAFGRLQSEYLKQDWFFTGQNIQSKKEESKANMEFILANKNNLPSLEEVKQIYKQRRDEWNNAPHPATGIPRKEMYRNSENPATTPVQIWDMINIFWVLRPEPISVSAYGINFKENGVQMQYMVYKNDSPDIGWLRDNIDKKVWIKTDPEDSSLIALYDKDSKGELRFLTYAQPKTIIHRNKQEQEDWEAAFIKQIEGESKRIRVETRDAMDDILEQHGMLPEQHGLNSPLIAGVEKAKKTAKRRKVATTIGSYQKAESLVTETDEFNLYDIM